MPSKDPMVMMRVRKSVRDRIRRYGQLGETFSDAVERVLDTVEEQRWIASVHKDAADKSDMVRFNPRELLK